MNKSNSDISLSALIWGLDMMLLLGESGLGLERRDKRRCFVNADEDYAMAVTQDSLLSKKCMCCIHNRRYDRTPSSTRAVQDSLEKESSSF